MRSLYDAPQYYRMLFDSRVDDVRFYRALADRVAARHGRPTRVIDYGAGTGRITLALAAGGHTLTAVENATAMIDALHARIADQPEAVHRRITVCAADARSLALEARSADLVVCAFNGLAHFETDAHLTAFLGRVRSHLALDGLFAFDVWLPAPALLAGTETRSPWLPDPQGGGAVRCIERFDYEAMSQVLTTSIAVVDRRGTTRDQFTTRLRQFFPRETLALLAHHGLRVLHRTTRFEPFTGGAARGALEAPGEMLAYVCAAAE